MSKALPHLSLPLWPQLPAQLLSPTPCVLVTASYSPIPNKRVLLFSLPLYMLFLRLGIPTPPYSSSKIPSHTQEACDWVDSSLLWVPTHHLCHQTSHLGYHIITCTHVSIRALGLDPWRLSLHLSKFHGVSTDAEWMLGLDPSVPPHLASWLFCPFVKCGLLCAPYPKASMPFFPSKGCPQAARTCFFLLVPEIQQYLKVPVP